MHSTFHVISKSGELLGIFPADKLVEARPVVQANPGAEVKSVVTYDSCAKHPAYEPHNCPICGTAAAI